MEEQVFKLGFKERAEFFPGLRSRESGVDAGPTVRCKAADGGDAVRAIASSHRRGASPGAPRLKDGWEEDGTGTWVR